MRIVFSLSALMLVLPVIPLRSEEKPEYAEVSRLIQSLVTSQAPRQYEDTSGWGMTIPFPVELRRPGLRRTVVKVGDRMELPHGPWIRSKVWIDDPGRDVQVRVTDMRKAEAGKGTRLSIEATVALHGERERQQWLRGLRLVDLTVQADAVVVASFDVDVAVRFKAGTLPPELVIEPKVVRTQLDLKRFDLHRVGPVQFTGKDAQDMGEELRGTLQGWLKQYEPRVTERLNEAVTAAVKSGKVKPLLPPLPKE
jgi:hypothetical protein